LDRISKPQTKSISVWLAVQVQTENRAASLTAIET